MPPLYYCHYYDYYYYYYYYYSPFLPDHISITCQHRRIIHTVSMEELQDLLRVLLTVIAGPSYPIHLWLNGSISQILQPSADCLGPTLKLAPTRDAGVLRY